MNQWILADLSLHLEDDALHGLELSGKQQKALFAILLSAGPIGRKYFTPSRARRLLAACASFNDPSLAPILRRISRGGGIVKLYPEMKEYAQELLARVGRNSLT
jgi:hypothetical protein